MPVSITLDGRVAADVLRVRREAVVRGLAKEYDIDQSSFNACLELKHPIRGYVYMLPKNGDGKVVGGGAAVLARIADDANAAVREYLAKMSGVNVYGGTTPAYGAQGIPGESGGHAFDRRRAQLPPGVDLALREAQH